MKKSSGRRKIEIKKIDKKSTRQVTFSKRRAGLFNKAAELSLLCGAEIAILLFSSRDKIHTFGHPNVDALLDRFLTRNFVPPKPAEAYLPLPELNLDLCKAEAEFEIEKKRAVERLRNSDRFWWDEPLECMRMDELKSFRSSLLQLRANVAGRLEKIQAMRIEDPPVTPSSSIVVGGENQCVPSFHLAENQSVAMDYQCLPSFDVAENQSFAMDWEEEIWG